MAMASAKRDIIAIGGSAGSGAVLRKLIGELSPDLPASVFVCTHMPAHCLAFCRTCYPVGRQFP